MNGHIRRRVSPRTGRVSYQALVYVDKAHGGPRTEHVGSYDLERDANDRIITVLARYQDGSHRRPTGILVRDLVGRWLRESVEVDKSQNTLRHHTLNNEHHIDPYFGSRVAEQVRPDEIAAWQAQLRKGGRRDGNEGGSAPKSILSYRATLHAAYSWGLGVGLVSHNPVADAPAPRHRPARPKPPSVAEMDALVEALRGTRLFVPTLLLAATGMRRGEVLALRWRDIDLKRDGDAYAATARVDRDRGNLTGKNAASLRFGPPKTRAGARKVPLPAFAAAALWEHRTEQRGRFVLAGLPWNRDTLVCCGGHGQPIAPDAYTRELWRFRTRHGLERIHAHLLRHAVATIMLDSGVRLDAVRDMLGHASIQTTADVYGYVHSEVLDAAAGAYGEQWRKVHETETRWQMGGKRGAVDELAKRRAKKKPA